MPTREAIAAILSAQLDYIFFFYGLAFVLLGVVCFSIARLRGPQSPVIALGLFGLAHGAAEWLELIALIQAGSPVLRVIHTTVMTGSFLFLMDFARIKAVEFGIISPGRWLYLVLLLVVASCGWTGGVDSANAVARYVVGFPAAIGASLVFLAYARKGSGTTCRIGLLAAVAMALYGIAAGVIIPAAPFWPANSINQDAFIRLTGVPVQLVRALLACLLATSFWGLWGQLLTQEIASEPYAQHLRRQLAMMLAAMTAIVIVGWALTQLLGNVYRQDVERISEADIRLLASGLANETGTADRMVKTLAGSSAVNFLLRGGSAQEMRNARSFLDLTVETSGARFGAILDLLGTVVASSERDLSVSVPANQSTSPWFRESAMGKAGRRFDFVPSVGGPYYYASAPVRDDAGAIIGVAILQTALDRFEVDLRSFRRPYYLINPDGVVVITNRPDVLRRGLWPLAAERKSALLMQSIMEDDRPALQKEIADATWVSFGNERYYLRRLYVDHGGWSLVMATPSARISASRSMGIMITLLAAIVVLIYFLGREHGIRERVQIEQRMELQQLAADLRHQATTDRLTGLYNRAKFDETLEQEIERSQRYQTRLALIMYDVDHFKQINDIYGHQVGDAVLARLSGIVSEQTRKTDLLARWGGEEFAILTAGQDGLAASRTAEKLRSTIERTVFDRMVGGITCSFGVAHYVEGDTPAILVARADDALYRAKANGRNRVELAPEPKSYLDEPVFAA